VTGCGQTRPVAVSMKVASARSMTTSPAPEKNPHVDRYRRTLDCPGHHFRPQGPGPAGRKPCLQPNGRPPAAPRGPGRWPDCGDGRPGHRHLDPRPDPARHPTALPEQARRPSSAANEKAIAAASKYPTRLRALSTPPMSSPEQVVDELVRAKGPGPRRHHGLRPLSANAAALYSLEIVGLPDQTVGPAKTLNETIDPIETEQQ
jgi:hypothetical protein